MENNNEIYNAFQLLQKNVKEVFSKTNLIGTIKYQNKEISNVTIHITAPYFTKSEILMLCNLAEEAIKLNFPKTIPINLYIKENNTIVAFLLKEKTENTLTIHILEEK